MTPPLPEPVLSDADPSHAARAALEALFEKLRTQRMTALEWAEPPARVQASLGEAVWSDPERPWAQET